ncbi:MAG: 23S rRNA (guanosine(2251)-2'-O)-methyltransferase RlmB [Propionibacteriaceae bacterium]|nr:23S rRNA (guanosine(2251)-2'-O)-methyltransferase RlmB [Propionibacteriaceae bacterium]
MAKGQRTAGSGGRIRKSLAGRGPTPKAEDREYHAAHKAKQANLRKNKPTKKTVSTRTPKANGEYVIGRNPVLEALRAGLPVKTAYIVEGGERDERLREILKFTAGESIPMLTATRGELDRLTGGAVHQGVALLLPNFEYADLDDVLEDALGRDGIIVVCDHITDPHNLGAIIRSAAAFGASGVVIPERRSARMTAAAWKASAGAAAREPVVQVVNLNRAIEKFAKAGFTVVGLDSQGETTVSDIDSQGPMVLVVGSEGEGLSRLVSENCDVLATIEITSGVESLNASVATAIGLYELTRG